MQFHTTLKHLYEDTPSQLYRKNAILFDTFHKAQGLYYIASGQVKLSELTSRGQEYIIQSLGAGDMFPLTSYFLGENRSAIYTASSDVHLQWRSRQDVDDYCDAHPEALREMIRSVLTATMWRVSTLSLNQSEHRVLRRVQELASRFGKPNGTFLELILTQQELADSVNLSRESVSGILNRLETQNIVRLERNKLLVALDKVNTFLAAEL